ncbi:OTU domain-containing protein 5 [Marchantia polymorpha subsp. ruderalis]|uniref:ubiquitinyl hydrolase 1 n=1 Tax=Marchantia polymorpha TaxID=3197 RepID=A0A2R6XGS0_MARPO|nr:hypothetical protein MARPO_0015s0108 [Marchantia polymorpha]BBN01541.1 hypothetical protein Mp_2g08230 [Marchantia polymorpha subsp. ruderalis]|eukprot:PTQ45310.1 hypothetical protein MARPO_0015s0108 [Marchantia polymorpha]
MTRVVVQRGAAASNSSHNRSSSTPPSSATSSQASSHASVQPSHSPPSGSHAEEEIVLEAKEVEPVNFYGGESESLVTELINKAVAHQGPYEGRGFEREQTYGYGECSDQASTSSSTIRETEGRVERDGVAQVNQSHSQRQEGGRDSSEIVESLCLQQAEAAKEHGEEAQTFPSPSKCDRDGGSSSCDSAGPSNEWKPEQPLHPPQSLPPSFSSHHYPASSSWHASAGTLSGPSASSPAFPLSFPSQSSLDTVTGPDTDHGRPNFFQNPSELVGCSYNPTSSASQPLPSSSSRRNTWVGVAASRGGFSRRGPRACKPSRISPNSSRPTSPKSYGEGDGYNSADEQTPWSSGSAGYENNGEREHQFEVEIRRAKNLEVRRMAEDGNCLFRAVADQVYGDAEMYDETRQMCIDYMEKERDHFSQFVTESFTAYCKRKRRDKVHGNNLEIQAMAEMYNRPIHIFSYSMDPINIFHGHYETDLPPIRLSYHRGNHYNSLIDPSRPAIGAGLGFGSLRGTNVDREQVKAALKAQQDQQIDKALLAEGRFYSDLELTEQEIQRMVIEASRAEFFEEESHRHPIPWCEETSTSAAAEPSSSGTNGSPRGAARTLSLAATSTTATDSGGLTSNVRMLLSMGFSYLQVMEACSIFGDDVNNMLCYLLETEGTLGDGESIYRMKGKAAER